mmetsp:Transcript_43762/g.115635  ORF Transcript_43762/g.115635 Transcript_43762/m.115635 type:complete len:203 (-) Transcript_43762:70-678(-)
MEVGTVGKNSEGSGPCPNMVAAKIADAQVIPKFNTMNQTIMRMAFTNPSRSRCSGWKNRNRRTSRARRSSRTILIHIKLPTSVPSGSKISATPAADTTRNKSIRFHPLRTKARRSASMRNTISTVKTTRKSSSSTVQKSRKWASPESDSASISTATRTEFRRIRAAMSRPAAGWWMSFPVSAKFTVAELALETCSATGSFHV